MNTQLSFPTLFFSFFIFSVTLIFNAGFGLASKGLLVGKLFTGQTGKNGLREKKNNLNLI